MTLKAAAYQEYNQAAILDKMLGGIPELVKALGEPLSKIDKITIVSTGEGNGKGGIGASQMTGDLSRIVAQAPALFESLTGLKVSELMKQIPAINAAMGESSSNGNGKSNGNGTHALTTTAPLSGPTVIGSNDLTDNN